MLARQRNYGTSTVLLHYRQTIFAFFVFTFKQLGFDDANISALVLVDKDGHFLDVNLEPLFFLNLGQQLKSYDQYI